MKLKFYRHGDLLIQPVQTPPDGGKKRNNTVLLAGEVSGHHHRLSGGAVYDLPDAAAPFQIGYFTLEDEEKLTHEEHGTIVLPPGAYKFYSQREYDEQADRRVID
jgi:hypothetical protein